MTSDRHVIGHPARRASCNQRFMVVLTSSSQSKHTNCTNNYEVEKNGNRGVCPKTGQKQRIDGATSKKMDTPGIEPGTAPMLKENYTTKPCAL